MWLVLGFNLLNMGCFGQVVCFEKVGDELVVSTHEVFFINCATWNVSLCEM